MDQIIAKKPTKFFGLSRNIISMGAVSFLNDLSSDMIFPFIPIFLTSVLGATVAFVGLIEGVADATASILKIVSGRISDRMSARKPFAVFGYSLSALSKPLLALSAAPWQVLGVRFIDRVGKGTRDAPRDALISFSTEKKDVGRAFGFHRGADTLGAALGPLVAFAVLPLINNDLRTLFLLSFAASAVAVVILWVFVKEVHNGRYVPSLASSGEAKLGTGVVRFRVADLGLPFFVFLAAATVFSLGRASDAFLLLRARDVGITLALIPIIYFVYNVTFAILATPAGILSDRIGHRNTFMIGMLVFSGTYFLFAYMATVQTIWLLFALFGFYSALTEGVGKAIVADLVAEEARATAFGIYSAFTGLALLPASVVFGVLWDKFSPAAPFYYGAVLGLLAFVLFLFFRVNPVTKFTKK